MDLIFISFNSNFKYFSLFVYLFNIFIVNSIYKFISFNYFPLSALHFSSLFINMLLYRMVNFFFLKFTLFPGGNKEKIIFCKEQIKFFKLFSPTIYYNFSKYLLHISPTMG